MTGADTRRNRSLIIVAVAVATVAVGTLASLSVLRAHGTGDVVRHAPGRIAGSFAAVVALTLANLGLRWLRWRGLVRRVGVAVPARTSLLVYTATLPAVATPFYLGELARVYLLRRWRPDLVPALVAVWFLERLADTASVGVITLLGLHAWLWVPVVLPAWAALHLFVSRRVPAAGARFRQPTSFAFVAVLSLVAWTLPVAALLWTLGALHAHVGVAPSASSFGTSALFGGITALPGGVLANGFALSHGLRAHGAPQATTAVVLAVFRTGTTWFAAALGLVTLVARRRTVQRIARGQTVSQLQHFEQLAPGYSDELPRHTTQRLLERKVEAMRDMLVRSGVPPGSLGLDLGSGPGHYAARMSAHGYRIVATDAALGQVETARTRLRESPDPSAPSLAVADGTRLPFADGSFDFAYAINVLHHMTEPSAQARALAEIVRVLRPGGQLLLQEMNASNPVLRGYLGHVYPLLYAIDDGTEVWLDPRRLPDIAGARWSDDIRYFTFIPEFMPARAARLLHGVEQRLERSRVHRRGAHFIARLVRDAPGTLDAAAGVVQRQNISFPS